MIRIKKKQNKTNKQWYNKTMGMNGNTKESAEHRFKSRSMRSTLLKTGCCSTYHSGENSK